MAGKRRQGLLWTPLSGLDPASELNINPGPVYPGLNTMGESNKVIWLIHSKTQECTQSLTESGHKYHDIDYVVLILPIMGFGNHDSSSKAINWRGSIKLLPDKGKTSDQFFNSVANSND